MTHKASKRVLAYDLGGTKVAVGVVSSAGKVIEEVRMPAAISEGKEAVINQLAELGLSLIKKNPGIKRVGIASAGPLDPTRGLLLDPTNFSGPNGSWGQVPLAKLLARKLKREVYLENDAAAAMLAEHWVGAAKGYKNAMILTLGTGLGTGIISNGELVRAGHFLHPEAGHLILKAGDETAPCGCGNLGCAEAYLSGKNFGTRASLKLGNPRLSSKEIAEMARLKDARALAIFDEYAYMMATAIHNYVVIYCPEVIVFTGSFAATADLFLGHTKTYLEKFLERRRIGIDLMPDLKVSTLDNKAGVIGGAYVAFHR